MLDSEKNISFNKGNILKLRVQFVILVTINNYIFNKFSAL